MQDAYREAIVEHGIVPLTNADVEVVEAVEGKPLRFKATVQVRPEVELGDYSELQLRSRDRGRGRSPGWTRSSRSCATRTRPSRRSRSVAPGTATGPSSGSSAPGTARRSMAASAERMPLIIGEDRLIPGFEANLVGLKPGDTTSFDVTFPDDYPEAIAGGQAGALRGRRQGAAGEDPARGGRRVRALDGRLRGPRRAPCRRGRSGCGATRSTGRGTNSATGSSSTR